MDPAAVKEDAGVVRSWSHRSPCGGARLAVALIAIGAAALAIAAMTYIRSVPPVPVVTRFRVTPADGLVFPGGTRQFIAISPDGTQIAYVVSAASMGQSRLYVRSMAEMEPRLVVQTEAANAVLSPAFSPDGTSIAFWSGIDQTIKKVAVTGGAAITICSAEQPFGMSWDSNAIFFAQDGKRDHACLRGWRHAGLDRAR